MGQVVSAEECVPQGVACRCLHALPLPLPPPPPAVRATATDHTHRRRMRRRAGVADTLLRMGAASGSTELVASALLLGADPDLQSSAPVVGSSNPERMRILNQQGANGPLHIASYLGHEECVELLLRAAADPHATAGLPRWTAAHLAAAVGHAVVLRRLLAAEPRLALARMAPPHGTPLAIAIQGRSFEAAQVLMEQGAPRPAGEVLGDIAGGRDFVGGHMLFAALAAAHALTPAQWARLPTPCRKLGTALPAVVRRSRAEAGLLVKHLPWAARERLYWGALCVDRAAERLGAPLPPHLLTRVLALIPGE